MFQRKHLPARDKHPKNPEGAMVFLEVLTE
jgi:hypothetical protein